MTDIRAKRTRRWLAPAAIALGLLPVACSAPQIMIGQSYSIPTPPAGDCPALLWQFVVDSQRTISGALSHVGQPPFAKLSGTLAADESFRMTATTDSQKSSSIVSGTFSGQITTISIQGNAAGAGCDGKTFALRLGAYFAQQGGGGGGGG